MPKGKGGLIELSVENSPDQYPLLQNGAVPLSLENVNGQDAKNVDKGTQTSSNGAGCDGLHAAVNDTLTQMTEDGLLRQADSNSSYCSISHNMPVQDEQGIFLQPAAVPAESIIGTKRKGMCAIHLTS